jgi:ketosteroid isomerase-like protein
MGTAANAELVSFFDPALVFRQAPQLVDQRVLLIVHDRLLGREGLQVENDAGAIFTFQEEKIVRVDHFTDRESARRAFEAEGSDRE